LNFPDTGIPGSEKSVNVGQEVPMGTGTSIVLIAVGAILRFAVSVTTTGFNIHTIGVILMVVGIVGLCLSIVFWSSWGGFGGGSYRRTKRVVRDGAGGSYVEERGDGI
jgi:hypothetical protein